MMGLMNKNLIGVKFVVYQFTFFIAGEHCEQYVRHFESLFGTESLAPQPNAVP